MTVPLRTYIAAVVLSLLCLHGTAHGQMESADAQMQLVVKLRIHRALQSTEETAAGVFVGKDRQSAYFITACHAVIQDDARVRSVQLRFHDSPHDYNATVFEHYDPVLDLAIVLVPVGDLPSGMRELVRRDPTLGMPVHVIGHPAAGDWSMASGTVQNLNTPTGDIHHFITSRDNSLAEGHSGGPVFDALGSFLGMHTASGPTYGIEAKSGEILNQLAAWHVPSNNITTVQETHAVPGGDLPKDRDAINGVIDSYVDAYNKRDADALWQIWPSAPAQTRKAIETYFRDARSVTMRVTERKVEASGGRATVTAKSSQEFVPKNGSPQKSPESPISFDLEKKNGAWVVSLVR